MIKLLIIFLMLLSGLFFARPQIGNFSNHDPDSLIPETLSGIAIVDSSSDQRSFYLDKNLDGKRDYYLIFGPEWYIPVDSNAHLPADGDFVTISGGNSRKFTTDSLPGIVVYEIFGLIWRDPYSPRWNHLSGYHNCTDHLCNMGFAFDWALDSLSSENVYGTIMIDSIFTESQFYLDVDNNHKPDYYLNFGPPWYKPAEMVDLPFEGKWVSIKGGVSDQNFLPVILVYEIDNVVWMDHSSMGAQFGGSWIHRNGIGKTQISSPFDSLDKIAINPGWYGNNMVGTSVSPTDSLFCQILEIAPENIPNCQDYDILAGYRIGLFKAGSGKNILIDEGYSKQVTLDAEVEYSLHYDEEQLLSRRIYENSIQAIVWDDLKKDWAKIDSINVDSVKNIVSFSRSQVSGLVVLTGTKTGDIKSDLTAMQFELKQNYPNPFNPSTTLEFVLPEPSLTRLSVYNIKGQVVTTLVNGRMAKGLHKINFSAQNLSSGVYFYRLESNRQTAVRQMILLK